MSEKRDYQEEMLYSKEKIVFCNWARGTGKNYAITRKIIENLNEQEEEESNFLIVSDGCFVDTLGMLYKNNDNIMKGIAFSYSYKNIYDDKQLYLTIFKCDYKHKANIYELKDCNNLKEKNIKLKYAFFNEKYPTQEDIDLCLLLGAEQIFIMITDENLKYIGTKIGEISNKPGEIILFVDNQIEELIEEFKKIEKTNKTSMYRNDILKQIKELIYLKERLINKL